MSNRAYIRSGIIGLPLEKQEELLAGFDGQIYRDIIPRAAVHAKKAEALVERAALLGAAKEDPGKIVVASIFVLAVNAADLVQTLTLAGGLNCTVHALDSDIRISPETRIDGLTTAALLYEKFRRSEQTIKGRGLGNAAAAERARLISEPKLEEARKLWPLPTSTIGTKDISEKVGLTVKTLFKRLGKRRVAQLEALEKDVA